MGGGAPHHNQRVCVVKVTGEGGGRPIFRTLRWGEGRGGGPPPPPPPAHLQTSDVSDQLVPDFSIAQETILVNRNSRKLQGASFRDLSKRT